MYRLVLLALTKSEAEGLTPVMDGDPAASIRVSPDQ